MFSKLQHSWQYVQFTRKYQQAFLEDLCSLIKDGVPASQAIETIREITTGITQQVASQISQAIAQGRPLADGMQGWFSRPLVEIIRTGENSGTLITSFESATHLLSQQTNAVVTLLNSITYPLTVLLLALGVTVFIKSTVLTNFAAIKPFSQWPDIGQNLYRLGEIIQDCWWLIIIAITALLVLFTRLLRTLTGDLRATIDKLPLFSLYRDTTAARFMETLGLLISNGVVLKKALSTMQLEADHYLHWHLLMMEFRLSGGSDNIADVLDTHLIRPNDLIRLRVVAKGKGFEHALISLGRQAQERNTKKITMTGKILGMILLLSGAMIAITIIVGIYTVGSSITR